MMRGAEVNKPVVQILALKQMGTGGSVERYRLMLSDGTHSHTSAMLATQFNDRVASGEVNKFSVIRIDKLTSNILPGDRRVIVVLDFVVLETLTSMIGNPQPIKSSGQSEGESHVASSSTANDASTALPLQPAKPQVNGVSAPFVNRPMSNGLPAATGSYDAPVQSAYNKPPASTNSVAQQQSGFYGAQQPARNLQFGSGGMGSPSAASTPIKVFPISTLTPYQNRWTIKARVTNKTAVRSWANSRGEGKLFSVTLGDESGEIRATAFKESVDKFFNFIEVNKVYYVSKMQLKTANKQYTSIENDYEMTFTNETQFIPCEDDDVKIPTVNFNFIKIRDLDKHEPNSIVDCLGIVHACSDVQTITSKQGKELKKRDIHLADDSNMQVRLTLWGADAENFNGTSHPVMAIKGCKVSDFGGRSLSSLMSSVTVINPDTVEASRLKGWYDNLGHAESFNEFQSGMGGAGGQSGSTNWKTLSDVKAENLGVNKADYFMSKATIVFSKKENALYMACANSDCNKKVVDQGNGMFRCEKCQQEQPSFKWRMLLQMNVADATDNMWATCFQDTAEIILDKNADEIGKLKTAGNDGLFDHLFQEAHFKSYVFKFRAKMETFNDENRLKLVCVQANPVDCGEYSKKLIADIDKMLLEARN